MAPATDLQTRSYWLGLDEYTPNDALGGDLKVDVALVGAGFTSLWTAYLLLKENPGMSVAILEANAVGYGASGRNGGFAMTLVHRTLAHLARFVGDDAARQIYRAAERAVEHINQTVAEEGIECDIQQTGVITLSNTEPQDALIHDEFETAQRLGIEDMKFFDKDAAQQLIRSPRIRCAVREDACSLVNPARLARGLKKVIERMGAKVYEGTAVQDWEETSGGVVLKTSGGTVTADRALLAPNAYGSAWKSTRDYLLPIYSYICLTRPLTDAEWESIGWQGREGAEDRRTGLHYFRPTIDGRILWGGRDPAFHPDGPKAIYDTDPYIFGRMRETFDWFFPQLAGVPFEHEWGGPVAVTGNFLPAINWFDSAKSRAAFAYGYNGHGVSISNLAAHAITDMFSGRTSEWTNLNFVLREPDHLGPTFIRNPLTRYILKTQLRADDEERTIKDPLALRLFNKFTGADLQIS